MSLVQYNVRDRIGFITLNRPEKRNALSYELVSELKAAFSRASSDENVKVIILNANGEAFCAGADLQYLQDLQNFSEEENRKDSDHLKELFLQIYTLEKIVIAQVQGHALAGGCGLASVCDFAIAVPEAKFGYTEVKIGFVPAIVMFFLLRKIGEGKARQLLLTGDLVSANDALNLGLIYRVVDNDSLTSTTESLAEKLITTNSADAMRITKSMIAHIPSLGIEEALDYASLMNAKARATQDCKRGIAAFLNKEKISW